MSSSNPMVSYGGIEYTELQSIINAHPDGITSNEIAQLIFGYTDKDVVSAVLHACDAGIKTRSIDIRKRRANMSTYAMWYPPSVSGLPMTELERCACKLGIFTPRQLGTEYYSGKRVRVKGYSKIAKYVELMATDGTIVSTGQPNEFRWVG